MILRSAPIDDITEDHLKSLITDEIAELRSIEYKQDLPGRSDSEGKAGLIDWSRASLDSASVPAKRGYKNKAQSPR